MATIEETLWEQLVKPKLPKVPNAVFPKAQQQALAYALQEWTAKCVAAYLDEIRMSCLNQAMRRQLWRRNY
jgi:hypothetical protein